MYAAVAIAAMVASICIIITMVIIYRARGCKATRKAAANHVTFLYNKDFATGTYIITTPGIYRLAEDIVFEPRRPADHVLYEMFPDLTVYDKDAYRLGFFAAIAIQNSEGEVIIDLNKHELKQGEEFALIQRFFACIELADQPFPPKKGPHNFGTTLLSAENVTIRNGTLGRSSHHGIHGNGCRNVLVEDVIVHDFEVGGIQINDGHDITLRNVTIGPSRTTVFVNGRWSALLNLTREAERFPNVPDVLKTAVANAKATIANVILNRVVPSFLANPTGLPDGSSIFGVAFHEAFSVDAFLTEQTPLEKSTNITIDGLTIQDLRLNTAHVHTVCHAQNKPIKDNTGAVLDIQHASDAQGAYVGNVLSEIQILLAKFNLGCAKDTGSVSEAKCPFNTDLNQNTIPLVLCDWRDGKLLLPDIVNRFNKSCNQDIMHHFVKGVNGLRLEGVENARVSNVVVHNLHDETHCMKADGICVKPCHAPPTVRGIVLSICKDVHIVDWEVHHLYAVEIFHTLLIGENVDVTFDPAPLH